MSGYEKHIVVVEAYQEEAEYLSAEAETTAAAHGLGLPLEDLAERLHARITVLTWDDFARLENTGKSFLSWMPVPATRPLESPGGLPQSVFEADSRRVIRKPISARDPDHRLSIATAGLSKMAHGLLANSDPLFFLSCCLQLELREINQRDPIQVIVLPMWGGLGYVPQLARATRSDGHLNVPFAVVTTDTSENRQKANQEGLCNRQAVTRRQSEAMSLALADLVLTFGNRGEAIAQAGRLYDGGAIVRTPRYIPQSVIDKIATAATRRCTDVKPLEFFLLEPQQPSSGVLVALDAVNLLRQQNRLPERPVSSCGPDMTFAPMSPKSFEQYWQNRAFVREMIDAESWRFATQRPAGDDSYKIRLYPYQFAHLPQIWTELGRGSHVLMSAAACEGLVAAGGIPADCLIGDETTPEQLAEVINRLSKLGPIEVDAARRSICAAVVAAHRTRSSEQLFGDTANALASLCDGEVERQDLGRVARLLLDRSSTLNEIDTKFDRRLQVDENLPPTLSVVVTCYEMGDMLCETIDSIWRSERCPDEVILVDDGSHGEPTLSAILKVKKEAAERGHTLQLIRQQNQGLSAARNRGLAAVQGHYVSFIDGDDLIEPPFYRIAMDLLAEYPHLGGVAAWSRIFNSSGDTGFWNAPQAELPFQYTENCIFVPVVASTKTLRELGGYDTRLRYNYEDWELSCRFLASGKPIVTIPAYLQRYRERDDSLLRTMTPVQNQVMRELFFNSHADTLSRYSVEVAMLLENRLMHLLHPEQGSAGGDAAGFLKLAPSGVALLARNLRSRLQSALHRIRQRGN